MKLPIPFLQSKKEESDYYLSLILSDEKVGAVILKAVDGSLKKINAHEAFLPEILEEISEDDLIASVDKAISRAEDSKLFLFYQFPQTLQTLELLLHPASSELSLQSSP
jgi:hypothetical protein